MRNAPVALVVVVLLLASFGALRAQSVRAPDGGTRTTITSIAVPPLPDAPFSATVTTEWTRTLEDGSVVTIRNRRLIARDRLGRVFQERRWLGPQTESSESALTRTEIADPLTHTLALCRPNGRSCELQVYRPPAATAAVLPAGVTPDGEGTLTRESLGNQVVNGLELVGTREITTINGARIGADRPLSITREFWYSAALGLNISTIRRDPRSGVEVLTVTDVNRAEPDAALFALPTGATIIDRRR